MLRSSADVVILGSGPAGSAAAIELGRALNTVVIAGPDRPSIRVGEAIPPVAKPLLQHLGLWDALCEGGHRIARGTESAWGEPQLRTTSFIRDPHGHGWILDRAAFDDRLQQVARLNGAQFIQGAALLSCERSARRWVVDLGAGTTRMRITTSWVIDCTGRRSWLARSTRTPRTAIDHLVAFVARYRSGDSGVDDEDAMTLVESAPDGWWYTVRVPNGDRLVAYLTDTTDRSARMARTQEGFAGLSATTRFIQPRIDRHRYRLCDGPQIVAADSSRLEHVAGEGWLAAGDAAASFDPLSSQGILTALDGGVAAAGAVLETDSRATVAAYSRRVGTLYDTYMTRRREIYQQESRWSGHDFWRRRRDTIAVENRMALRAV